MGAAAGAAAGVGVDVGGSRLAGVEGVEGVAASHVASESLLPRENLPPPDNPASQLQLAMLAVADAAI